MKGKLLILMTVFAVAFLVSMIQASAIAATQIINLTSPAAGTIISGSITLRTEVNGSNLSYSVDGSNVGTANITRVTFDYSTDGGSIWATFGSNNTNINNGTLTNWTLSVSTSNLSDTSAYTWRAVASNGTNGNNTRATSPSVSNIRVDNTIPQVSAFIQSAYTILTADPSTISVTAINTSLCTLRFGSNPTSYNMTQSGNTCTYSLSKNVVPDSTYDVTVTVKDGINQSTKGQFYVISLLSRDAIAPPGIGGASGTGIGQAAVQVQQQRQDVSLTTILIIVIAAIVIIKGKAFGLLK